MKRNLFLLFLLISSLSYYSCKKDVIQDSSLLEKEDNFNPYQGLKIINNMIEFSNIDEFNFTLKKISAIQEEKIYQLGEKVGFKSFLFQYYNTLIKLNEEKIDKTDINVVKFLNNEDNISKNLAQNVIASIINENGIFKIGKSLYYFDNLGQIIISDGSFEKLNYAKLNRQNNNGKGIFVFDKSKVITERAACGSVQRIQVQNGDRRATITSKLNFVFQILDGNRIYATIYEYHEGYPEKKNIWGNWVNYNATSNILELNYAVRLYNGSYYPNTFSSTNNWYVINYSKYLVEKEITQDEIGDYQGIFQFINVNRYKHQGMNNNWATIICQ